MPCAVPKVLILGHSFVKRLQSGLKAPFDARGDSNFHLQGTAMVHLFGVGGPTDENLRRYDLHVVTRLAPDVVILEVSTNNLLDVFLVPIRQYFLYQSYRGAILKALGRLRS